MTKVEELQVIISANADQFKGELLKIQNQLGKLDKNTGKLSDSVGGNLFGSMVKANVIGTVITGTFSRLFSGLGSLSGAIIENGSNWSRLEVATNTVTSNLGLTREEVQGLRDDLADANTYGVAAENVIKTLALSGLVDMARQLQAVDARTGKVKTGITALTLAMKDLAAANNIDSDVAIDRIAKFIQRGETSFADGLIEIGEINRAYAEYGRSIGKSSDMLTAQERAQVRLNIVMQEGQKVFGAYANTYESSGKIFSSIKMLLRSLTEIVGKAFEPVFRVGGRAVLEFLRGIQQSLFQSEGAIRGFANRVAGYMLAFARIIGGLLSKIPGIGKNFEGLAKLTLKPIQNQGKLMDSIGGTSGAMDDLADSTAKAKKEMAGLASFDELNVLNTPDASAGGAGADTAGSGGFGGIGGDGINLDDSAEEINKFADQAMEKFNKVFDTIDRFLKPLREIEIFGRPLIDWLGEIAKWVGIVAIALGIGAKVAGIFAAAIGLITSPVTLVILAIAALIAIGVYLYQNFESVRNVVDQLVVVIRDVLVEAWNQLTAAVEWFWINILQPAFAWIQENVVPTFEQIVIKVGEMLAVFQEKMPEIQAALQPLIESVGTFLYDAFKLLGQIIDWTWKNILKPLIDFVLANIVPAFELFINIVIELIKIISAIATPIIDLIIPVLTQLWETFTTVFEGVRDIVKFVWENVLQPILKALYDLINGLIIPVFKNIFAIASWVWNGIKDAVQQAWDGIYQAIKPILDWIDQNIMPVINRIKEQFEKVWNSVRSTVENVWEGIKNTVKNGINGVIDFLNSMIRTINGLIENVNSVATKIPGVSEISFRIGEIPRLAQGGVVNDDTLAMLHKSSNEAILPLEGNNGWIDELASKLNNVGGSNGMNLVVKIGEDTIYEKTIDYINEKSIATNTTILNI